MTKIENLTDYNWDVRYSSATHNLINQFFIPALERSKYYYRIAGFFSSTSIAAAARGISAFVENGNKMYLIVGNQLSKEDADAINNGHKNIEDILHKNWDECKSDFDKDIIRKRFELLSWLIANNKLEIKIGVNKDKNGRYLPSEASLFHEKILIFEDFDGNVIQLDGSINETWKAWAQNRESFCVHRSWVEGNGIFINTAMDYFNKVWSNNDSTSETMSLPDAIQKDLLSIRPKNKPRTSEEIDFTQEELEIIEKNKKHLRNYQEEAIKAWVDNNYIGVMEMATGTGKTFTALSAIERLDSKSKILLIAVPQIELANQWAEECENVLDSIKKRIIICSGDTDWKIGISREIRQAMRDNCLCVIIAVFNTMRNKIFINNIKKHINNTYLIIDEVHEIGSHENRKLLSELSDIKYRLGLSATPNRLYDDEGNLSIQNYFNGAPIFIWDMEKAINPPHGYDPCLCKYEYNLHDCSLNASELEEYEELSNKIKKLVAIKTNGGKIKLDIDDLAFTKLLNERADIIKECEDKYRILEEIIQNNSNKLNKCLVYCNDKEHMDRAVKIILKNGFNCLKFYGELDPEERERTFDAFENDDVKFLVAIKCLDQGIDLPICDSAIILASSRNPREYVQRRGRVLRLYKNKNYAVIHDLFVFPYPIECLKSGKCKLMDFEADMLKKQLERIKIFTDNSMNRAENLLKRIEYGSIIINSK